MKKNPLLAQLEARHQAEIKVIRQITRQEDADMFMKAANRAFGFGPERNKRLMDALNQVFAEEFDAAEEDTPDKEYSIQKREEELKRICGKYYLPRRIRYGLDI